MEISSNNSGLYFGTRLGSNLKQYLKTYEFGECQYRMKKFEQVFHDTFDSSMEDTTVIEMNKRGGLDIINTVFPKFKMALKLIHKKGKLSENIMSEPAMNYGTSEYLLFQKIISGEVQKGKTLSQIKEIAEKNFSSERKDYFFDLLYAAERIRKENPHSKLSYLEFSAMNDRILRELVELPEIKKVLSTIKFNQQ